MYYDKFPAKRVVDKVFAHYIPQFYLKGFIVSPEVNLVVFDRKMNTYVRRNTQRIAGEKDYYFFQNEKGEIDKSIEVWFSDLEGMTAPILKKIDAREGISEMERQVLATFIAFLSVRIPKFETSTKDLSDKMGKFMMRTQIHDLESARRSLEKYVAATGKGVDITPERVLEFVQRENYKITQPKEFTLQAMIDIGSHISDVFLPMKWLVLQAPAAGNFITSDSPLFIYPPEKHDHLKGVGYATLGARKVVPLTKKSCLIINDPTPGKHGIDYRGIDRGEIRNIMCDLANHSQRYVFGSSETQLRKIVTITKINELEPLPVYESSFPDRRH